MNHLNRNFSHKGNILKLFTSNSRLKSSGSVSQTGYEVQPTTMKIQKFDPKNIPASNIPPIVTKYSTKGFTIQGNKLFGSVAILPNSYFSWKVLNPEDICPEALQLFTLCEPRIELLVVGTGEKVFHLPENVRNYLRKYNIAYELQDTRNACSTFNFLLEEYRRVGAVLIPPNHIPMF